MDDEAALLARHVAMAASAWRHAKADTEAYRRLVVATSEWDAYVAPTLDEQDKADVADVAAQLRRAPRRALRARPSACGMWRWLRPTGSVRPTDSQAYRRFVVAINQ